MPYLRGHAICVTPVKEPTMEKRILGIILSLLGVAGLIMAAVSFMNTSGGTRSVKSIIIFGILGAVFFFAGIGLIRNTADKPS